jgi:hypothetical protein
MPRAFNSFAIMPSDGAPAPRISAITGSKSSLRFAADALWAMALALFPFAAIATMRGRSPRRPPNLTPRAFAAPRADTVRAEMASASCHVSYVTV